MTATKGQRHKAILALVNRGSVHTQQEIAEALARQGMSITQATISRDIQELGLVRAGRSYDPSTEVPFSTYARYRIEGEILDSLRKLDCASRNLRQWQKQMEAKSRDLSASLHRDPTDEEISESLGVEIALPFKHQARATRRSAIDRVQVRWRFGKQRLLIGAAGLSRSPVRARTRLSRSLPLMPTTSIALCNAAEKTIREATAYW